MSVSVPFTVGKSRSLLFCSHVPFVSLHAFSLTLSVVHSDDFAFGFRLYLPNSGELSDMGKADRHMPTKRAASPSFETQQGRVQVEGPKTPLNSWMIPLHSLSSLFH